MKGSFICVTDRVDYSIGVLQPNNPADSDQPMILFCSSLIIGLGGSCPRRSQKKLVIYFDFHGNLFKMIDARLAHATDADNIPGGLAIAMNA